MSFICACEFHRIAIVIALTKSYHTTTTTFCRANGGTTDGAPSANDIDTLPDGLQIGDVADSQEEEELQQEDESGAISSAGGNAEDARVARLEEIVQQLTIEVARQGEEIARLRAEKSAAEAREDGLNQQAD